MKCDLFTCHQVARIKLMGGESKDLEQEHTVAKQRPNKHLDCASL